MKSSRQMCIIELIKKKNIENQEELLNALLSEGYNVKQSTISRDIKQLGLVKVMGPNEKYHYEMLPKGSDSSAADNVKYVNILREAVNGIDNAQNIVIIKTHSGMAQAAAAALDGMHYPNMLGCIAGDDTIMALARTAAQAKGLAILISESIKAE